MIDATKKGEIRNALLDAGYTIRSFARRHGFSPSTTLAAVDGRRDGIVSRRIMRQILKVVKHAK